MNPYCMENGKAVGLLRNSGMNPYCMENHKATLPAFSVRPSSVCQQNAIEMAFQWQFDGGHLRLLGIVFLRNTGTKPVSPL